MVSPDHRPHRSFLQIAIAAIARLQRRIHEGCGQALPDAGDYRSGNKQPSRHLRDGRLKIPGECRDFIIRARGCIQGCVQLGECFHGDPPL